MRNYDHDSGSQCSNSVPQIAVIGSGYWGKNLIRNYFQLGSLKLICDNNADVLSGFKEQYPQIETCSSFTDVLQRDDISGLVIATPAETHFRLAQEALLANKHVYLEKPLVLNEADGKELIALARSRKLVLMVGHLLQYHPVFVYLKEIVKAGELGRINYIYSHRLNLGRIRREENILWSFAPHDISMILALTGEEPEQVFATGGNYLHQRIADVTTSHLLFPPGIRAHIFVSWLHPFKEQKLVVVGDKKMAVFDDTLPWSDKLLLYPHKLVWENNIPVHNKSEPEKPVITQDEPLRVECLEFLECISQGRQPLTDGQEGLRVLRVLKRSQDSLDTGDEAEEYRGKKNVSRTQNEFFVHPTAVLDKGCRIGAGTKIWHFSHVLTNSDIGKNCNIGQNVVIGPDVSIGGSCKIQNNVSVYKGVTLEEGVFCGPSMVFTNIYNPRAEIGKMDQVRPTRVKKGASIGANATILCGLTLGRYCLVGAGALVNKDVPDFAVVVGNPARQIGWVCRCGEKLPEDLGCTVCGKRYNKTAENMRELDSNESD